MKHIIDVVKVEPPRFLERKCGTCGHQRLEGWVAFATRKGFIYLYFCMECKEVCYLSVDNIYGNKRKEKE